GPRATNTRSTLGPGYFAHAKFRDDRWVDAALVTPTLRHIDAMGLAREDDWAPGTDAPLPPQQVALLTGSDLSPPAMPFFRDGLRERSDPVRALDRVAAGEPLTEPDIVALFEARGRDFAAVCCAADQLRARRNGDTVTYVVNRNINYTNICTY